MKALLFVAVFASIATAALALAEDKPMDQKAIDKAIDQTAQAGDGGARKITCKSGGDTRTIEIQALEGGGCKVVYTKGGEPQTIGEARHQIQLCDQILERTIKRLEGSAFECS